MKDKPEMHFLALPLRGALLGATAGAVLASIYAALAPLAFGALLALTNSANGRAGDALIGLLVAAAIARNLLLGPDMIEPHRAVTSPTCFGSSGRACSS